jgi:hypothetical protein
MKISATMRMIAMNVKKLFWKFYLCNRKWSDRKFDFHYVGSQLGGIMYAGVTLFGYSLMYSDDWG